MKHSSWRPRSKVPVVHAGSQTRAALSVFSLAAAFALAFALASYARGSANDVSLPGDLPVAALPTVALSDQTKVELNNSIGGYQAERFGIVDASFNQTRQFPVTGGEAMDVVPGQNGVCLVFRGSSGCGAPGSDSRLIDLYEADPGTGNMIGAGITDKSVRRVLLTLNGVSVILPVKHGIFVLTARAGLREPQDRVLPILVSPA
jgi:hypothetical protein